MGWLKSTLIFIFRPKSLDFALFSFLFGAYSILAFCICYRASFDAISHYGFFGSIYEYFDYFEVPELITNFVDGLLSELSNLLLFVVAGCLAPLPPIAASARRPKQWRIYAAFSCVCLLFLFWYLASENRIWTLHVFSDNPTSATHRFVSNYLLAALIGFCVLCALCTLLFEFLVTRIKKRKPDAKWKRIHSLIVFCILLAGLAAGAELFMAGAEKVGLIALVIVFGMIPGITINFGRQRGIVLGFLLTYFTFFNLVFGLHASERLMGEISYTVIYGMIFYSFVYLLIAVFLFYVKSDAEKPSEGSRSRRRWAVRLSVWTPLMIVIALLIGAVNFRYDLFTYLSSQDRDLAFQHARQVKIFNQTFNKYSHISVSHNYLANELILRINLDSNTDAAALKKIEKWDASRVSIENITPRFEAATSQAYWLSIEGKLTTEQLSKFLNTKQGTEISLDIEVVDSDEDFVPRRFWNEIVFKPNQPGDLAKLQPLLGQLGTLKIEGDVAISIADWKTLITSKRSLQINADQLSGLTVESIADAFEDSDGGANHLASMSNLTIDLEFLSTSPFKVPKIGWYLVLKEGACFRFDLESISHSPESIFRSSLHDHSDLLWHILSASATQHGEYFLALLQEELHQELANPLSNIFEAPNTLWRMNIGKSEKDISIFIPGAFDHLEDVVKNCGKARAISFDSRWLCNLYQGKSESGQFPNFKKMRQSIKESPSAKTLEEIYFPAEFIPSDMSFLEEFENLQVLQIRPTNIVKLGKLKNLKKLILLSPPSTKLLKQIKALPNLKSLECYPHDYFMNGYETNLFRMALPDIELVLHDDIDEPPPPEYFERHLELLKKELRKKYLPSDE